MLLDISYEVIADTLGSLPESSEIVGVCHSLPTSVTAVHDLVLDACSEAEDDKDGGHGDIVDELVVDVDRGLGDLLENELQCASENVDKVMFKDGKHCRLKTCELCPFATCRVHECIHKRVLETHIDGHTCIAAGCTSSPYVVNGNKQLKLVRAMYDEDCKEVEGAGEGDDESEAHAEEQCEASE